MFALLSQAVHIQLIQLQLTLFRTALAADQTSNPDLPLDRILMNGFAATAAVSQRPKRLAVRNTV